MSNQEITDIGTTCVMNTYGRIPISLVKGEGARVWDADGKEYLDFTAGIAVCSLGHCHPRLVAALQEQGGRLWHCSNLYWIKPQVELAQKLTRLSGLERAFFANSGAEVNEGAIKLARKYFRRRGEDRYEIISFRQSFHGRTTGALAVTGQTKYQEGFEPLLPGVCLAEFNDLDSVKALVNEKTCAVMVEPVQGEGGVNPADPGFMTGLSELCRRHGILLILDEVQCGMGRTGSMFAFQHYGIKPDILTLAKALGGGFPIGALLASEEAASGFVPGDHASTFGGNPLACAVASEVVDLLSDPELLENVSRTGSYLRQGLQEICVRDSRAVRTKGMGLMLGLEFQPEVKQLVDRCRDNGLLLITAGPHVLRFVPPLNITPGEAEEALTRLGQALKEWK